MYITCIKSKTDCIESIMKSVNIVQPNFKAFVMLVYYSKQLHAFGNGELEFI